MENLTTRSVAEMTKAEREYLRNELNEIDKNDIRKEIEEIKNNQQKDKAKMDLFEETQGKHEKRLTLVEKNTNIICSKFHSKRMTIFRNICKTRVWSLFNNDKTSSEYVLFGSFFFKKIYADIATHFELDTWYDIDMTEYDKETSMYNQAKEFAKYWTPSNWYVKETINIMIEKRDNGILSSERCRALTEYLRTTNNGETNPFSA